MLCFCPIAKSWPTLCEPVGCSTAGFPVLHYILKFCHIRPLSQWCRPTILSSVVPFSSCFQPFPSSGSVLMSQFFTSGDQSIEVSVSTSLLLTNIQDWFPLGVTGLTSLLSKGLWRVFSNTTAQRYQFFGIQPSLWSNSHICLDYWKNYSFDYMDLCPRKR